jgi:hypothetical protein
MLTLFFEVAAAVAVLYIVGLPFVNWYDKAKKEMSEKWNN